MVKTVDSTEKVLNGLYLFKSLIKDGCEWHGDVHSQKWSEMLIVPAGLEHQVDLTLSCYEEGVDYRKQLDTIWIA